MVKEELGDGSKLGLGLGLKLWMARCIFVQKWRKGCHAGKQGRKLLDEWWIRSCLLLTGESEGLNEG